MKKVTIRDVAAAAGVSPATVSRAVNGEGAVAEETRIAVERAIRETGYVIAQSVYLDGAQCPGLLYLIVNTASANAYARQLNIELVAAAGERNLRVITASLDARASKEKANKQLRRCLREAVSFRARGILISGFGDVSLNDAFMELLRKTGIPAAFLNRAFCSYGFHYILIDGVSGAYKAFRYMLEQGRRRLLLLCLPSQKGRYAGFQTAVRETGIECNCRMQFCETLSVESILAAARQAYACQPEPDGILCGSDEIAAGVLRFLSDTGRQVPRNVTLIGYDDFLAERLTPPISSVRMPLAAASAAAVDMLLAMGKSREAQPQTLRFEPTLIIR